MFVVYGTESCSYCFKAKNLLSDKKKEYTEIDIMNNDEAKEFFRESGFKTVPQIFHSGLHIGGFTELREYLNK